MGDSLGDMGMAEGVKHETLLSIGFLNHDVERLLPLYIDKFDIVITNDSSMNLVYEILQNLGD